MPSEPSDSRKWVIDAWKRAHVRADYAAPWSLAIADLSEQQAKTPPLPGRHTIAQIVGHICFWREYSVLRVRGGKNLSQARIERLSWPEPGENNWETLVERFEQTHSLVTEALEDTSIDASKLEDLLMHDCYHMGQIMYIRSMLGLKPIE